MPKDSSQRTRFAWCVSGSGHFLEEALAVASRLPALDVFLSDAAEEVLPICQLRVEELRSRFGPGMPLVRDKTASAVPELEQRCGSAWTK